MKDRNMMLRGLGLTLALLGMARETSAVERKGLIVGAGLGKGWVHSAALRQPSPTGYVACADCTSLSSNLDGGGYVGWMLNSKTAIGIDFLEIDLYPSAAFVSDVYAVAVRYWVRPRVWVSGGVGQAELSGAGNYDTKPGLGFLTGIGFEIVQLPKLALGHEAKFSTASIGGFRHNNVCACVSASVFNLF